MRRATFTISPAIAEELMWRGITPPAPGSRNTTCPHCSAHRKKRREKCLSLRPVDWGVMLLCFHCGWEDSIAAPDKVCDNRIFPLAIHVR